MSVDRDWAKRQLDAAGHTVHGNNSRVRLIADAAIDAADIAQADTTDVELVLDILAHLLRGRPIVIEEEPRQGKWTQFRLGEIGAGARVRVKVDAYGTGVGERFNGRLGHFSAARNGQALITFDDELGDDFASRHAPDKLEVYVFDE